MAQIEIPNTDPIFDPSYAHYESQRLFAPHLEAARNMREYGKNLLKRLLQTLDQRTIPDIVLIGGFLRQALVSFDAWLLCAEHGAAQAGRVHLRGLLEAELSIEWLLRGDKDRLARQVYVANMRDNRSWTRRAIPGTEPYRQYGEAYAERFGNPPDLGAIVTAARDHDRSVEDLLETPVYEPINRDFEAFVASRKYEPSWYEIGPNSVTSVHQMANELGRKAEYMTLYESFSDATHGSRTDLHFHKLEPGGVGIKPVRQPSELRTDIAFAFSLVLGVYQTLLKHYRPDESEQFRRDFLERWHDFMIPPRLEVNTEVVRLG